MATPVKLAPACGPETPASDKPDLRPVEGKAADEELALLTKAVGHPARVQILRLLVRRRASSATARCSGTGSSSPCCQAGWDCGVPRSTSPSGRSQRASSSTWASPSSRASRAPSGCAL
jgi:hypothetical protein